MYQFPWVTNVWPHTTRTVIGFESKRPNLCKNIFYLYKNCQCLRTSFKNSAEFFFRYFHEQIFGISCRVLLMLILSKRNIADGNHILQNVNILRQFIVGIVTSYVRVLLFEFDGFSMLNSVVRIFLVILYSTQQGLMVDIAMQCIYWVQYHDMLISERFHSYLKFLTSIHADWYCTFRFRINTIFQGIWKIRLFHRLFLEWHEIWTRLTGEFKMSILFVGNQW